MENKVLTLYSQFPRDTVDSVKDYVSVILLTLHYVVHSMFSNLYFIYIKFRQLVLFSQHGMFNKLKC